MATSWRTCATVPQLSELQFGVVRAVDRGTAVLDGVHVVQGKGDVLEGFVLHFHSGKCHWVVDGEMFPIRMRKHDNISVRQTYLGKLGSCAFWRYIQFQDQSWGLREISKTKTYSAATSIFRTGLRLAFAMAMCASLAQCPYKLVRRNKLSGDHFRRRCQTVPWDTCSDAALFPNYFGQTCYY